MRTKILPALVALTLALAFLAVPMAQAQPVAAWYPAPPPPPPAYWVTPPPPPPPAPVVVYPPRPAWRVYVGAPLPVVWVPPVRVIIR